MLSWLVELGWWPHALAVDASVILLLSSLFTSALTAAFGLGGGVIMLALLVNFIPITAVIPIHGVIQMSSNISRGILLRQFIVWEIVTYYFLGAIIGALLGGYFVIALSEIFLLSTLGIFILYVVWGPKLKSITANNLTYSLGGVVVTFSTMFIGATGPLAMALLPREALQAKQLSATHGLVMVVQHGLKIIVFSAIGFQFKQWAIFLLLMLVTGFIGSYTGRSILNRLPEAYFKQAIKIILTLLAIKMLVDASIMYL
jgi:uncharacterized membrane protein YfcA